MPKSQAATTDRDYPKPLPSASSTGPHDLDAYGLDSEAQFAQAINRSIGTLRRWRAARCGPPFIVIQRQVYYRREAVAQWLLKREKDPTEEKGPERRAQKR
jgi:hypothetical protein